MEYRPAYGENIQAKLYFFKKKRKKQYKQVANSVRIKIRIGWVI